MEPIWAAHIQGGRKWKGSHFLLIFVKSWVSTMTGFFCSVESDVRFEGSVLKILNPHNGVLLSTYLSWQYHYVMSKCVSFLC